MHISPSFTVADLRASKNFKKQIRKIINVLIDFFELGTYHLYLSLWHLSMTQISPWSNQNYDANNYAGSMPIGDSRTKINERLSVEHLPKNTATIVLPKIFSVAPTEMGRTGKQLSTSTVSLWKHVLVYRWFLVCNRFSIDARGFAFFFTWFYFICAL